jgi:hypothetical protein
MSKEKWAELFQYCSPHSILVVTWYGRSKELYCPITVKVKTDVGNLKKGNYEKVESVVLSNSGVTVFEIKGAYYFYHYFDIMTHL